MIVEGGGCGVSCLQVAWGFVYAGFTDGCVKTWAVTLVMDETVKANPVNMVRLTLAQVTGTCYPHPLIPPFMTFLMHFLIPPSHPSLYDHSNITPYQEWKPEKGTVSS